MVFSNASQPPPTFPMSSEFGQCLQLSAGNCPTVILAMFITSASTDLLPRLFRATSRFVFSVSKSSSFRTMSGLSLQEVVKRLEDFAPLKLAESWDNVGLLIEPFTAKSVEKVFLTNDLTERVLKEAIDMKADLIVAYHPPIFAPLKRITQKTWKERLVSACLENRIALYSPHTSWDCVRGGVCDWLSDSFPHDTSTPITPHAENDQYGLGRLVTIKGTVTLKDAIELVKKHTGIKHVHVGIGVDVNLETLIQTVALCAGSGASVLKSAKADLFVTGEMSHHEVLDCTQRNISVILCNHSNSERGYLRAFKNIFEKIVDGKVKVIVTETDVDPLVTY